MPEKIKIIPRELSKNPNRTHIYLVHIFKKYGEEFEKYFRTAGFISFGIGNFRINKETNHVHCLADIRGYRNMKCNFKESLEFFRAHEAYVSDYVYTKSNSPYHTIVLKLPEDNTSMIDDFIEGNFSRLYSEEDLQHIKKYVVFPDGFQVMSKPYGVITKDKLYRSLFQDIIREEFNFPNFVLEDDREIDFKPSLKQEIFNYHDNK